METLPELPAGLTRTTSLVDRLRGIYTISVDPAVGPLNGSLTHTRRFEPTPINLEAATQIERLKDLARLFNERAEFCEASCPRHNEVERAYWRGRAEAYRVAADNINRT